MLVCNACHRHYRFEDARCPFCGTAHHTTAAPGRIGLAAAAALATGLMLFACTGDDDGDTSDSDETTTDETGDDTTDTGDDTTTTDTDSSGSEYGAAPPPEDEPTHKQAKPVPKD